MRFLSRFDDFESIVIDGSVVSSGLSTIYLKDAVNPILRIGNNTGDSFITYDGTELSISSDVDLRLTTPTDQDVFLITSSGNIVTTQGGGTFTIGGGLTLENFGAGYLKTDANGVVSIDADIIEDTLDSVTDRGNTTTNAITVGGLTVGDSHFIGNESFYDNLLLLSSAGESIVLGSNTNIFFNTGATANNSVGTNRMYVDSTTGNVGIGTTNPLYKLDVNGSGAFNDILNLSGNQPRLQLVEADTTDTNYEILVSAGTLFFRTANDALSSFSNKFSLTQAGVLTLNGYGAGLLQTNASGVVSVNTTSYTPTSRSLTINGTAYDLSADRTWTISTITGNAGSATVLQTARTLTIGNTGKTFDGSADVAWTLAEIGAYAATNPAGYTTNTGTVTSVSGAGGYGGLTLTGTVTTSGNITLGGTPTGTWPIGVSGNAASATTFNGLNFSGLSTRFSSDLNTLGLSSTSGIYNIGAGYTNGPAANLYGTLFGIWNVDISVQFWATYNGDFYWRKSVGGSYTGSTWRTILDTVNYNSYVPTLTGTGASGSWGISVTGNAATATKLQTARTINGTSFDGSANITTASWGTARNVTIGSSTKSVDGSANVSFSLAEIGAQAAGSYLTAESDTLQSVTTRGSSTTTTMSTNGGKLVFRDDSIENHVTNGNAAIVLNYYGYATGTTQFRDTIFYNGKSSVVMFVDGSSSNVGIGTTNPTYKLDVSGSLRATGNIETSSNIKAQGYLLFDQDGDFTGGNYYTMEDHVDGYFRMGYAFNSDLVISTAGSIGIGTTAPESTSQLHIKKTSAAAKITLETSDSYESLLNFSAATNEYSIGFNKADNTFRIANANSLSSSVRMVINGSGNVGIGTTNPQTELHVKGNNGWGEVRIEGQTFASGHGGSVEFYSEGTALADIYANTSKDLILRTNGSTERVRITSTGTVVAGGTASTPSGSETANYLWIPSQSRMYVSSSGTSATFNRHSSTGTILGFDYNGNGIAAFSTDGTNLTLNANNNAILSTGGSERIRVLSSEVWFKIGSSTTGYEASFSNDNNGFNIYASRYGGTGKYLTLNSTGAVENMRLLSNGNVGIGTTSPGVKLDVIGTVRSYSSGVNYGQIANGSFQAVGSHSGTFMLDLDNTGTADLVNIKKNGTSRFYITNDGSVGIGTTSPATKLHVVGTAETRLRVGSSNASSNVVLELRDENSPTGQGTVITYNSATGETYFNNALSTATTDFHFQSGEYGTASDFFALSDVGGNSIVQLSTATGDAFITYEDAINELAIASDGDLRLTTPTDQDVFYISSGGNIDMTQAGGVVDMGGQLTVDGNVVGNSNAYITGNVGIGTTSPSYKLQVEGNVYTSGDLLVGTGNAASWHRISVLTGGFIAQNGNKGIGAYTDSNANTDELFAYNYNTSSYIPLKIRTSVLNIQNDSGSSVIYHNGTNVGIGTTAPQQLLHIKGATEAFIMLEADSDTGIAGTYYKSEDTDDTMNRTKGFFGWQGQTAYGNGYFTMWLDTVEDNGAVTSSEEKFRWERDGDFHADGDVIAYSTTTPSDARLKKDVSTIENASEKVAKLRGVEYTWNTGSREGKREIGLIAQEVEAVVPEVVTERQLPLITGTAEEYKTVDYERLIALLIESNKEMQKEIAELKSRLDGLTK